MLVSELVELIRFETLVSDKTEPSTWLTYSDDQLLDLVSINAPLFSRKIGALTLGSEIENSMSSLILLKAHIDICYRMAMGEARNYPLMAEGASLRKDYIFEHYMSLIRSLKEDLKGYHDDYKRGTPVNVSTTHMKRRVDQRLVTQKPNSHIELFTPLSGGFELTWDKFDHLLGGYFKKYSLLVLTGDSVGYDAITGNLPTEHVYNVDYYNPLQLGARIEGLEPLTEYKVLLVVYNALGMFSVDTKTVTTL